MLYYFLIISYEKTILSLAEKISLFSLLPTPYPPTLYSLIPIPKNNAILAMGLQLLSNNNA